LRARVTEAAQVGLELAVGERVRGADQLARVDGHDADRTRRGEDAPRPLEVGRESRPAFGSVEIDHTRKVLVGERHDLHVQSSSTTTSPARSFGVNQVDFRGIFSRFSLTATKSSIVTAGSASAAWKRPASTSAAR